MEYGKTDLLDYLKISGTTQELEYIPQYVFGVKSGDTVILRPRNHVSRDEADRIKSYVQSNLPKGVKCIILHCDIDFFVMKQEKE